MHHIADPDAVRQTLAEMVRVCKPSGRILVWDHNPRNPYWSNLMARVPQDTGEERLIGEREIMRGLNAAGAQVLSSDQLGLVPDFTPRAAPRRRRARAAVRADAVRAAVRGPQRDPRAQAAARADAQPSRRQASWATIRPSGSR